MDDGSDARLIERSLAHPRAFEQIFDRHFQSVRRYAQARVGLDIGEDIAAETFAIAFETRSRFDPAYASAKPWLLGIATNLARHHLRSEHNRMKALARRTVVEVDDPIRVEAIDAARFAPVVFDALSELSLAQRETFLLLALGQLSYQEIATVLDVPIGTVRSRIFHTRKALRERMDLFEAIQDWTHG